MYTRSIGGYRLQNMLVACALLVVAVLLSTAIFKPHIGNAQAVIGSTLSVGSSGADVTSLQQFLAESPSIYPEGLVTGYYGLLTRAAVTRLQIAYNIDPVGQVGPITRNLINNIINSGKHLDVNAPIIMNFAISTSGTTATLSWNTNQPATGEVYYGVNSLSSTETAANFVPPYISGQVVANSSYGNSQQVTLTGLTSGTTYHYIAESVDQSGNVMVTTQGAFVMP